jgi:hypothetical protein
MSRAPAKFRKSDVERAINAVQACGLVVARTEIGCDGSIVLVHDDAGLPPAIVNELDVWRARRNARSA